MMRKKYDILSQAGVWTLFQVNTQTDDGQSIHYYQLKKENSNGMYQTLNFQEKNLRILMELLKEVKLDDLKSPDDALSQVTVISNEKVLIDPTI